MQKPTFCKPGTVPIALQEDLSRAYDAGIANGFWTPVTFNAWGTPVVPARKTLLFGESKARIRVCGDYSFSVNSTGDSSPPITTPRRINA